MPLAAAATIGAIAIGILQIANPDKVIEPAHDKAIVSDMPSMPSSTSHTAPTPAPPLQAAKVTTPVRSQQLNRLVCSLLRRSGSDAKAVPPLRKGTTSKFASEEQVAKRMRRSANASGGGRQWRDRCGETGSTRRRAVPGGRRQTRSKGSAVTDASPPPLQCRRIASGGLATNKLKSAQTLPRATKLHLNSNARTLL
jgi:hypothetical protein